MSNKVTDLLVAAATMELRGVSRADCELIALECVHALMNDRYPQGAMMDWLMETDRLSLFVDTYTDEDGEVFSPEDQWRGGMITWIW